MSLRFAASLLTLAAALALGACSADPADPADVAVDTQPDAQADAEPDTAEPDVVDADTADADAAEPDTADATVPDAADAAADTSEPDASEPVTTAAVPGALCPLTERVGIVELSRWGAGSALAVTAWVEVAPSPWYGAPELSSEACDFHRFDPGSCGVCAPGTTCSMADAQCVPMPARRTDPVLTLSAGAATQSFTADPVTGDLWGNVTLSGETFAAELTFAGQRVTLSDTAVPGDLEALSGAMGGTYDQPSSVDVTWTPTTDGADVHTLIPINHHAAGPTFTRCRVPGSAGQLHVDGPMLTPLAVITGLEFQGVQHVRFAAADTPAGCVELRWLTHLYTSLD